MLQNFFQKTSSERRWFICSASFPLVGYRPISMILPIVQLILAEYLEKPTNTSAHIDLLLLREGLQVQMHIVVTGMVAVILSDFSVLYLFVFQGKHRDWIAPLENYGKLLWQLMQWKKGSVCFWQHNFNPSNIKLKPRIYTFRVPIIHHEST